MADGDGSGMSEVVVWDLARMEVMDSCVDVEIGLDVVVDLVGLFELLCGTAHAVSQGTIA